jgi:hypothetical protein
MSEPAPALELLNIYQIEEDGQDRFLVCFLEPVLAGIQGIPTRAVVGDFTPRPDGEFDPQTFRLNPEFVAAFALYMNEEMIDSPDLAEQGRRNPGGQLFLVDPRITGPEAQGEPDPADVLGWLTVEDDGAIQPESFTYNPDHVMFQPDRGPSGILMDRQFYDWLQAWTPDAPDDRPTA